MAKERQWGEIERRPSGRYRARYLGPDGNRYPAPAMFDTRLDAMTWLDGQRRAIRDERWTPEAANEGREHRHSTFGQYAEAWFRTRTNGKGEALRPRTIDEYHRLLRGPLSPLSGLSIQSISPAKVRTWHADQLATGRGTQTARAYDLMKSIMSTAVDDRIIDSNPCRIRGGSSTRTGRKVTPPTPEELEVILETIAPQFKALVVIAAAGGLRYGEITELRRRDVTIESGLRKTVRIRVDRAVTRTSAGFVVGKPKSEAGTREVVIFGADAEDIMHHINNRVGDFGDCLLFPPSAQTRSSSGSSSTTTHLAESTFTRAWYPARAAADREDMPFHALRHFHGTRYAQAGATPKETMARLGHSTMAASMRYQHATGREDDLAARLAR